MSHEFNDAFNLYADQRVLKPATPAEGTPSHPATGSNGEPATRQTAGTFDSDRLVATCGKCRTVYTLAEFEQLEGVGWPGERSPKFWRGSAGDTYEMRNCACGSSLSRLVTHE